MLQRPEANVSIKSSSFSTYKQLLTQSLQSLRALAEPSMPLTADPLPSQTKGMLESAYVFNAFYHRSAINSCLLALTSKLNVFAT